MYQGYFGVSSFIKNGSVKWRDFDAVDFWRAFCVVERRMVIAITLNDGCSVKENEFL